MLTLWCKALTCFPTSQDGTIESPFKKVPPLIKVGLAIYFYHEVGQETFVAIQCFFFHLSQLKPGGRTATTELIFSWRVEAVRVRHVNNSGNTELSRRLGDKCREDLGTNFQRNLFLSNSYLPQKTPKGPKMSPKKRPNG